MLRELGAQVIEADALGREVMEPGHEVYDQIVARFGHEVVNPDGHLNRGRLADLAFRHDRLQELNAIVHPPVIEAQRRWMDEVFARDRAAVAVLESALIFEVARDALARGERDGVLADWRRRIDRIIVVTAPDELKVARYVSRVTRNAADEIAADLDAIKADARNRLAHQIPDAEKVAQTDYVLDNSGDIAALRAQVAALWPGLAAESNKSGQKLSLE
jgi:dephospho-CoA kinase